MQCYACNRGVEGGVTVKGLEGLQSRLEGLAEVGFCFFLQVLLQLVRSRHTTQHWPPTVHRGETRGVDQQCAQSIHVGSENVGPIVVIDNVEPILVIHMYPQVTPYIHLKRYQNGTLIWGTTHIGDPGTCEGPCIDPFSFVITCFTPQHGH